MRTKAWQELSLFTPLAREVESMAESLIEARAAAETEARLRDAGEHQWTAERLAVHIRERFGSSRIFVMSNREPYMHVLQGRETVCMVPPSGLVTAIEPVLRACDGVWVAHGSGSEDALNVDKFDRLRVPPDDPRYTLRRVWLSSEEEAGYYDGFANEGLWPLCHIAHTRPIFRASDWEWYQRVNEKFAAALLKRWRAAPTPLSLCRITTSRWCRGSSRRRVRMRAWPSSGTFPGPIQRPSAFVRGRPTAGWIAGRGPDRISHSAALQ
jgi:hypothetical protein